MQKPPINFDEIVRQTEQILLVCAMEECGLVMAAAAEWLGISYRCRLH